MSIDYSKVTGISDHIGNIVKITDASGNVLWKQAPSGATITLIGDAGFGGYWGGSDTYAEYNGTHYKAPETFEAAIGDTILFSCASGPRGCTIYLNGNQVATGLGAKYSYTVSGNAEVDIKTSGSGYNSVYNMYITEL